MATTQKQIFVQSTLLIAHLLTHALPQTIFSLCALCLASTIFILACGVILIVGLTFVAALVAVLLGAGLWFSVHADQKKKIIHSSILDLNASRGYNASIEGSLQEIKYGRKVEPVRWYRQQSQRPKKLIRQQLH